MRKVQDVLGDRVGKDIYFLSIALQSQTDIPEIPKEFSDNFGIEPGWMFQTGKSAPRGRSVAKSQLALCPGPPKTGGAFHPMGPVNSPEKVRLSMRCRNKSRD